MLKNHHSSINIGAVYIDQNLQPFILNSEVSIWWINSRGGRKTQQTNRFFYPLKKSAYSCAWCCVSKNLNFLYLRMPVTLSLHMNFLGGFVFIDFDCIRCIYILTLTVVNMLQNVCHFLLTLQCEDASNPRPQWILLRWDAILPTPPPTHTNTHVTLNLDLNF